MNPFYLFKRLIVSRTSLSVKIEGVFSFVFSEKTMLSSAHPCTAASAVQGCLISPLPLLRFVRTVLSLLTKFPQPFEDSTEACRSRNCDRLLIIFNKITAAYASPLLSSQSWRLERPSFVFLPRMPNSTMVSAENTTRMLVSTAMESG